MKNPGTLTIRGGNILAAPILVTNEAKVLEFRNSKGELLCFWRRVFDDASSRELWAYCPNTDPEWDELCIRYGYSTPKSGTTIKDALGG